MTNLKCSFKILIGINLFLLSLSTAIADVTLPKLISDHMVIQREKPITVWGWADKGEQVTIKFNKNTARTTTDGTGKWKVTFKPMKAGGPYIMTIAGKNAITISDVFVGDVWFCSGQSNMVLPMERLKEKYPAEVANANYPEIRNFFISTVSDVKGPREDLPPGEWKPIVGAGIMGMGGATYFFAKNIYEKYHVPIGIINASVGGTPVEAWISENGFKEFPKYEERIKNFKDTSFMNKLIRPVPLIAKIDKRDPEPDLGTSGPKPWYDPTYEPKGWHKFWLPGYLEDQGVRDISGIIWFRKEIELPAAMAGIPANLYLGRIVDADNVYVNGDPSGFITYQYPPRRYPLPAGRLKAGKNVIVVKVTNTGGKGGFVPDKPYYIVAGKDTLDLRGEWKYRVGQVFPARTIGSGGGPPFSAQSSPTGLYNTMVAPVIPFAVKGFVWYQGEANTGRANEYEGLLKSLANDWRTKWNEGQLPFIYVQLPNFMDVDYLPSESQWAELRNAQLKALDEKQNMAMVVTIELGEWNDIHPLNKKGVGERIALAAEHLAYENKDIVYSGPMFNSYEIQGNKVIISFTHVGGGLMAKGDSELHHFAIAGEDKYFVWAKTKIEGDKVIVWSDAVEKPVMVKYAWADNPEGANLYNKEGLPASPFRINPK